jgi:alkaline phosphatase D
VVLAGDTHNAWASNLTTLDGTAVGVELATSSVTSPGLEYFLQLDEAQIPDAEQALTILVDGLDYTNLSQRGFLVVTFRPEAVEADWRYVSTVKSGTYSVDMERSARRRTLPGASNRTLQPLT